jgi:hypothetical protein
MSFQIAKLACVLIVLTPFGAEKEATAVEMRTVAFHNHTESAVRVFFLHADIDRVFCIVEVAPKSTARLKNVAVGKWFSVVISISTSEPVASAPLALQSGDSGGVLNLTGNQQGFRLRPF